jgi:hypothetical protein
MGKKDVCPICEKKTVDMRHVGVECFYNVSEITNKVNESKIFVEVDEKTAYWGTTRRYPEGTRDHWKVDENYTRKVKLEDGKEIGVDHTKIDIEQLPIEKIRLLEKALFSINCCKSCRSDFLAIFKSWTEGGLIELYELKQRLKNEYDVNNLKSIISMLLRGVYPYEDEK